MTFLVIVVVGVITYIVIALLFSKAATSQPTTISTTSSQKSPISGTSEPLIAVESFNAPVSSDTGTPPFPPLDPALISSSTGSPAPPGTVGLNVSDIATFARNAGFVGQDLITAVAVALAESGGNPQAYNPETKAGAPQGQGSYGLWQIFLKVHPEFQNQDLFDPQTNALAAYAVYVRAGYSFSPWSTWNNGSYTAYLDSVSSVVTV